MALKKPWVGWVYQAPHTNTSRGVAILIAKTVQFQLHSLQSDRQGQFLFIHATFSGLEVLLLAYYTPPIPAHCPEGGSDIYDPAPHGACYLAGGL